MFLRESRMGHVFTGRESWEKMAGKGTSVNKGTELKSMACSGTKGAVPFGGNDCKRCE